MKGLIFRNGCALSSLIKLSKPLELTVACVQKGCLRGTTHGYGLLGMWRWGKRGEAEILSVLSGENCRRCISRDIRTPYRHAGRMRGRMVMLLGRRKEHCPLVVVNIKAEQHPAMASIM
jgi:hypothetical protein